MNGAQRMVLGGCPRRVLDNLLEGCQVIGFDWKYLYVNAAAAQQGRRSQDELLGRTMLEAYPGIDGTSMFSVLRRCMEERAAQRLKNELTFPDGSQGWFDLRFEPIPEGVLILSTELTERKHDAARIVHLNALLRGIRNVNQLITRERDPQLLIQRACELLVESRGFDSCCIAVCDGARVTHLGDAGAPAKLEALRQMRRGGDLPDCVRRALTDVDLVVRADPAKTCHGCPVNDDYTVTRDAVAVRLEHEGMVYGALLVSVPPGLAAEPEELGLLREVAGDVAFALHGIETERRREQAEEEREIGAAFLRLVNECTSTRELVGRAVRFFREKLAFEAVGVRLQAGDDFPYYEARGFPEEFVLLERSLCRRDAAGCVVRDDRHSPVLDCMCGNVIRGRFDPAQPFFTRAGSFWTNSTTQLLAGTTEQERLARTRNRCNGEGYESVGLFALRSGEQRLGLLQLNDHRPGRFTPGSLALHERLAALLAAAVARTLADEALVKSERRYRSLFDNMAEGLAYCRMLFDGERPVDFIYLDVNGAFETLTGLEHVVGRRVTEVIPGIRESDPRLFEVYGRVALTGQPERFEIFVEALSDWFDVSVYSPEREHFIAVFDVITERKRTEEQLRLAQRMEAIGSLAGGVAHDFNNLLSVIIAYAEFAGEGLRAGDPLRDDLEEIRKAGARATALTRQLLAFSRKQLLKLEVINLNSVIGGMESMLRRLLGEDIELAILPALDLGHVKADPGQVEQVVMNLAVNSRDAMPTGGRLAIETSNVELDEAYAEQHVAVNPGSYVLISVTDGGCGMDEPTRARVFEPFFTTKEVGKGTGLGLSTVYGIVKQSGGNISVDSELGRGTTFKVYLPRELSAAETAERPPVSPPRGGTETILVVEDEEAVRNLAKRILRTAGYTVLTAASGGDALLACERQQGAVHLMLTDVVMPQMSGRELAERVAKMRPDLRVLYMSGYTDNAIGQHGVLEPGIHFIGKPFNAADLTRAVREVLDENRASRPMPSASSSSQA